MVKWLLGSLVVVEVTKENGIQREINTFKNLLFGSTVIWERWCLHSSVFTDTNMHTQRWLTLFFFFSFFWKETSSDYVYGRAEGSSRDYKKPPRTCLPLWWSSVLLPGNLWRSIMKIIQGSEMAFSLKLQCSLNTEQKFLKWENTLVSVRFYLKTSYNPLFLSNITLEPSSFCQILHQVILARHPSFCHILPKTP